MSSSQFDVIVVGAGAAGLSAAIGLARGGCGVPAIFFSRLPPSTNSRQKYGQPSCSPIS